MIFKDSHLYYYVLIENHNQKPDPCLIMQSYVKLHIQCVLLLTTNLIMVSEVIALNLHILFEHRILNN